MYSIDKHHGKHMLDAYCEGGDKLKKGVGPHGPDTLNSDNQISKPW